MTSTQIETIPTTATTTVVAKGNISPGEVGGIAAGIATAFIIIGILLFFFIIRRNRGEDKEKPEDGITAADTPAPNPEERNNGGTQVEAAAAAEPEISTATNPALPNPVEITEDEGT
jgi:cell division protein FtsN